MIRKNLIITAVIIAVGIATTIGFASDAISQLYIQYVKIDDSNHPKPVDFNVSVKEVEMGSIKMINPDTPLTLRSGDSALYTIRFDSNEPNALPLKLKVFNADDESASNLVYARVEFNEDVSGLPKDLIATLENNVATIASKGNHEEILRLTIGPDVKAGNYNIGIAAISIVGNVDDVQIGNARVLTIPIIVQ
jgi:hypothetical protein